MEYLERLNLYNRYFHWLKGESIEQAKLVLWLEQNGYNYTSIPNSTYTKSIKQRILNKLLGLNPGLCDMLIILKRGSLLFLELKKQKGSKGGMNGSKLSNDQKKWIECLGSIDNVEAMVGHGYNESIKIIEDLEKK